MPRLDLTDTALKDALKEAIVEDALQDMAIAEAIREAETQDRKMGPRFVFQQPKGEA